MAKTDLKNEGITFTDDGHRGKRIKISWKESEYDGTRRERGHEWKGGITTNREITCGFILPGSQGQDQRGAIPGRQKNDHLAAL